VVTHQDHAQRAAAVRLAASNLSGISLMSMSNIFQIAGSALTAQSQRLNVAASNLANADSVAGPDGQPYRARQVVFRVAPVAGSQPGQAVGGVKVAAVLQSQAPFRMEYRPDHPLADAGGYVAMPNVNGVDETLNMMSASRSSQA